MEELIDVFIAMGAERVIYDNQSDFGNGCDSIEFNFNGKHIKIVSGGCHDGSGYLTADVSDEVK